MTAFALIGTVLLATAPGALEVEPEALRPGLTAVYRTLGQGGAQLHRIDAKPAFFLGGSSPHPRIPDGPFEVVWNGILQIHDAGPIAFGAFVGGELRAEVDGVTVLDGAGRSPTSRLGPASTLTRPPGHYPMVIRFRSLRGVDVRLQVFWEAPAFAREPLPAWRLTHLAAGEPTALGHDERAARGREAAGRLGCARCHQGAMPSVDDPPPGPSLADASRRLRKDWLLRWLDGPSAVRPAARMPALFRRDRSGFVERWLIADLLSREDGDRGPRQQPRGGNHRAGRQAFVGLGCAACHLVPDVDRDGKADDRMKLEGLGDRMSGEDLAAFLGNPHGRYPDGRMPRLPVPPGTARDIAAYLLLWSPPSPAAPATDVGPTADEIRGLARRLGVAGSQPAAVAAALLVSKGCAGCHTGLGPSLPQDVALRPSSRGGCLSNADGKHDGVPTFPLDGPAREALSAFLDVAATETTIAPFDARQRQLARAGCVRCHERDGGRPPIEQVGQHLGGAFLTALPYQRTPRLAAPHQKFTRAYLVTAIREGVSGLRAPGYTYRMPAYGADAPALAQAIAEADGELPAEADPVSPPVADPTIGTLAGPDLVGSRGYGCISCHVWAGKELAQPDPGAVGPDLTRLVGRIRRDWFDRFLDNPSRHYPGTPMPAIFRRGEKATLATVLDGDPARQKDALWSYFARGREAPAPKPPPPLPIEAPAQGEPAIVAQIPIRLADGAPVEALCVLTADHDLVVYDLARAAPVATFTGGRILRTVQGRTRQYLADGKPVGPGHAPDRHWQLIGPGGPTAPSDRVLHGYDRLNDGVRIRARLRFPNGEVEVDESLRIVRDADGSRVVRGVWTSGIPAGSALELRSSFAPGAALLRPDRGGFATAALRYDLPPAQRAGAYEGTPTVNPDPDTGSLERPGYRAWAFPRPKTASGADRVMPGALAVGPRDGRLFVASLETGELFVVDNPRGDTANLRFQNYARGLFQDAFAMRAEDDALYVLHRRNLTRVADTDLDGLTDRFDRVSALPHGVADTYDYAYGLVRERSGAFLLSYAPYANRAMPGAGGIVRLFPGQEPREIATGLRNPLGWCAGPEGEAFFTDNQGEWVAANKLCHVEDGRYYGFPIPGRPMPEGEPAGRAAVWVPYAWARSINGVAYDDTGGKFGPFGGQFFLAELMFGGAIVRADLERVNGRYQGACFPFWGKGLLGPVSLAFDPRGHLYVGGITEPGWMAQPDRGAVFRIDFTGSVPFEMRTIRALPQGFRVVFTRPVDPRSAGDPSSYRLARYRYEYTGSYGSPELDRTPVAIERAAVSADGLSVDLATPPLVKDRVYYFEAPGVRSAEGEPLVHSTGAYTLNEIPNARE